MERNHNQSRSGPRDQNSRILSCYNCGAQGHFARDCPTARAQSAPRRQESSAPGSSNLNGASFRTGSSSRGGSWGAQNNRSNQQNFNYRDNRRPSHSTSTASSFDFLTDGSVTFYPTIDIGINLTSSRFRNDLQQVIQRSITAKVNPLIMTGVDLQTSRSSLKLVESHPGTLYSTVGCHPHEAKTLNDKSWNELVSLASRKEVIAIGETGLDFNRMFSPQEQQEFWFEKHIQLAIDLKKPMFLHERDAHESFVKILEKYRSQLGKVIVHCFTGEAKEVKKYVDMDLHIGFTGAISQDKNGRGPRLRAILSSKVIPLNRLMIETDGPFMSPGNAGGFVARNEPCYLPFVLKTVAECYGESEEKVAREIYKTTTDFFGLPEAPVTQKG